MLKLYLLAAISLCIMAGCASSDQKQHNEAETSYPNLTELKEPGQNPHKEGTTYIDSVKEVTVDSKDALLIAGNLADGCTHLESVSHAIEGDTLTLHLSVWRDAEAMCTQALVPFSFIYEELDAKELARYSKATVNGKTYAF